MNLSGLPQKFLKIIASIGETRTVPDNSLIGVTPGAASLETGFVPLNRTPVGSGGVPPSIRDLNEFLRRFSNVDRWLCAGGGFTYDSAYATAITGYPKGAKLVRDDGLGYWLNTVDANTEDPEASSFATSGWIPMQETGVTEIDVTGLSSNITLTPEQYGKKTIEITGDLTANLDIVFPASSGEFITEWMIINSINTSIFSLRAVAGTGITTYLNKSLQIISNYLGMSTISGSGSLPKLSNGLTPVSLIKVDSSPALIIVSNVTSADWWLIMLYDNGFTVVPKIIDSVVTSANGETFTATRNPYELKIAVTSGTEAFSAELVK